MTRQSPNADLARISVRLLDAVDAPLRARVMRQGEFATYVVEAIETTDLEKVPLVRIRSPKARDTTIRVNRKVFAKLTRAAKTRDTSVNILINTALAHWLGQRRSREVVQFQAEE